jgi:hypothetical protein
MVLGKNNGVIGALMMGVVLAATANAWSQQTSAPVAWEPTVLASVEIPHAPAFGPAPRELRPCGLLRTEAQARGLHAANLWPDNTVYYAFHPNTTASNQAAALNAMSLISGVSAVIFIERTTEPDYVVFTDSSGNNSFIGRIGGPQTINIFNWGTPFVIVHEIMHALGIYHEQSRPDRDTFVQINYANICPNCCGGGSCDFNFDIVPTATMVGPYDFDSVMHYGQCFFSDCFNCFADLPNCRTITVQPPYAATWQNAIGQSDHFSDSDILTIQTLYPTPCTSVIGDLDDDGDSDLADAAVFQRCYDGGIAGRSECACGDASDDDIINAADVGAFVTAIHGPGALLGACCDPNDGLCSEDTASGCASGGGNFQGVGVTCAATTCPVSNPGACCDPATLSCTETSGTLCAASGGIYKGDGTACAGGSCPLEYATSSQSPYSTFSPGANVLYADGLTLAGTARNLAYYDLWFFGSGSTPYSVTASLYTDCPGSGGTLIAGTTRTFNGIPHGSAQRVWTTFDPPIALPNSVWMVVSINDASASWIISGLPDVGSTADNFGINQPPWTCTAFFGSIWSGFQVNLLCVD